jgi:mycofactocin precursor
MEKMAKDTCQHDKANQFDPKDDEPMILEEIEIEELFIDGICGVY